jgi:hypothetical protein
LHRINAGYGRTDQPEAIDAYNMLQLTGILQECPIEVNDLLIEFLASL